MRSLAFAAALLLLAPAAPRAQDAAALYGTHCAQCHGADRFGGAGPALLPENLERLRGPQAIETIANGRPATQMGGYADRLSGDEIAALVAYITTPPATPPVWDMAAMRDTHWVSPDIDRLAAAPVHEADPLHLVVVVESGDHHVTILDGDRFEPVTRFQSRFALHGGPKFSPDGRFVTFASRDGWITRYDLYSLQVVAEIRAGLNTRNLAIADDGSVVAVANYLPRTLVLLDAATLAPRTIIDVADAAGEARSRVSAVYQAAPRGSFIAALKDVAEVWEIPIAARGAQDVRRIRTGEPLDDFFFDPAYRTLVGSSRGGSQTVVIDLDQGQEIRRLAMPGLPHLGSGIAWNWQGRTVMATPNLKDAAVSVIDTTTWELVRRIPTAGAGFFLRGHEGSPYVWTDAFLSRNRDTMQIIDTRTLEVVRTIRPEPGRTAGHVEFSHDGRHAMVSIWEMDGALLVYDAATFQLVKRIPMVKPSGKYSVINKITRSSGTSH
ncbi:MAG: c-type cytochrome [Acetobacteraceae bacterium]|nr:c-type cytochrome [Acetobacteraceae bacterium]